MKPAAVVASLAAPTAGPLIVSVAGINVPVLALCLSITALVLARTVAPPPLRKLTRMQEVALTLLLLIFLFVAVIGETPMLGNGTPMGPGMAVCWGAGLGFSGLLVVELAGRWVTQRLRSAFGLQNDKDVVK